MPISWQKRNREQYKKDCLDGGMTLVDVDRDAFRDALTDYYKTQFVPSGL